MLAWSSWSSYLNTLLNWNNEIALTVLGSTTHEFAPRATRIGRALIAEL